MTGLRTTLLCASAMSALTLSSAALGAVTIADIAPPTSVLIAGTTDFSALQNAFKNAGLMDVWEDPAIRNWVMGAAQEGLDEFESELENLGFELDDLSPPEGPAGIALYIDPTADFEASPFNMIALADFGSSAEKMAEFLTAAIEESERTGEIDLSDEQYRNVTIYTIEQVPSDDADQDDMDWDDEDSPFSLDTVMYAWSGSSLVYGTNIDAVQDSIDALAGQGIKSIADDDAFLNALALVGQQETFTVVRTAPLFHMMEREEAAEGGMPVSTILKAAGLRDVHALSMGLTFDSPKAVSQWTFAALAPNRTGIFELFENPAQAFTPPAFAGGDASSLGAFQFDFAGLVPLARQIIAQLPPQMQEGANQMLPQVEMMAGPILANLGPRVYTMQTITRPFNSTSQQMLFAIQAKNEAQLTQTIAGFAPMMQLQSREFMGGQIWAPASAMPGVPEIAFGIASGHLFVGPSTSIESAIRTAADANTPRLANEARVKQAFSVLPAQGLGYTWSDLHQSMEFMKWSFANQEQLIREQITAMYGDDPEFAPFIDEEVQTAMDQMPEFMNNIPDLAPLYDVLGDMVGEYHFTDDGVVMKGYLLRAAK